MWSFNHKTSYLQQPISVKCDGQTETYRQRQPYYYDDVYPNNRSAIIGSFVKEVDVTSFQVFLVKLRYWPRVVICLHNLQIHTHINCTMYFLLNVGHENAFQPRKINCYCSLEGTKVKWPYLSIIQIFQNVSQFRTVKVHVWIIVHDVIRSDDSASVRNNI